MKKTPLNQIHENLGAKMVEFAGYQMPVQYFGVKEEHMAVRENVGVFDVSHMGQFKVTGSDSQALIQNLISNDVSKLKVGQAQYSCLTNEKGGIIDDLIVYKLAQNDFMLVVNASRIDVDWDWISKHNNFDDCQLENISEQTALIAVQGPNSTKALQNLTPVELNEIPFYQFKQGNFAGIDDVIISATGYTGSGGFELYLPAEHAEKVWQAIFDSAEAFNILPCGLAARDTLRLEKAYCLYGNDINEETTPLEAGLGWVTKLHTNFTGKEVIELQKNEGVTRKLIGFKMTERGIPRKGYEIFNEKEEKIGEVTSGTQSPILNEGIGLGYVKKEFTAPGTEIWLKIRNKNVGAKIVKTPFV